MIDLDMMMAYVSSATPATIERVIHVGGRGDPLALNVNIRRVTERDKKGQSIMVIDKDGQPKPKRRKIILKWPIEVKTKQDAVTIAYVTMAGGFTVDINYIQMNSNDLLTPGFAVGDMLDNCENLATDVSVSSAFYVRALKEYPDPQTALRATLLAYNIGGFNKGYLNGYLARYGIGNSAVNVPAINSCAVDTTAFVRQPPKKGEATSTKEEASSTQQVTEPAKAVAPHADPVVSQSQEGGAAPGVQVEHTVGVAEASDAFHETTMSESNMWESNVDLVDDPSGMAVMLKGKIVRPAVPRSAADPAKA